MTTTLLSDPPRLRNAQKQLLQLQCEGRRELTRLVTLAECNFRMAVHAETDSPEAIDLLREAVRIDGSNPKYAYHLGRVYFLRGEFVPAARWFRLACCLVPTSHRIWAHVSVLLREMNSFYYGDERYEANVLRERSNAIAQAIQAGEDHIDPDLLDFVPPRSRADLERAEREGRCHEMDHSMKNQTGEMRPSARVSRYLNARQCRWSGIDHLFVEQTLESRATQNNVSLLAPVLQRLVDDSIAEPGRPAAIVILCIQWLVRGFPVTTVRRVTTTLPATLVSTQLLDLVCQIFEAPVDETPRRVAAAIDAGRMPPSLGALIHRERLLWHPLEYRSLGAYRAACRALVKKKQSREASGAATEAETRDDEETLHDLLRRVERGITGMTETRPKVLRDEIAKPDTADRANADSVVQQLQAIELRVNTLVNLKEQSFRLIKEELEAASIDLAQPSVHAQAIAARRIAEELTGGLAEATQSGLEQCQMLNKSVANLGGEQLPHDFAARCEECVSKLQSVSNLGKFAKVLKRIDKRLAAAEATAPEETVEAAAEWSVLLSILQSACSEETSDSAPVATTSDRIGQWLEESSQLKAETDEDWSFIRECESRWKAKKITDEEQTRIIDMRRRFDQSLTTSGQQIEAIARLRQSGTVEEGDIHLLDQAEQQYRKLLQVQGKFQKKFSKLPELQQRAAIATPPTTVAPTPSADESSSEPANEPGTTNEAAVTAEGKANRNEPPLPKPLEEMTAAERLHFAIGRTNWLLRQMYVTARKTLDAYPTWIRSLPSFESLERRILAREAETLYRLGRIQAARRIWNGLLRLNRLHSEALRNIAVCDTVQGDVGRSLASWREYVELLYFYDVLEGTPNAHAAERAEFHRALGNGYAPNFLSAKFKHDWKQQVRPATLISFLSSAGRFRSFIDHRLLEYLNARFSFESPSLVLGIKRVEVESRADDAEATMTNFAREASELIPERVAQPFLQVARAAIAKAANECRNTNKLILKATPKYEQEEKQQIEMLARMFDIKIKLVLAFREHVDMVKNITSLDFLSAISRLDLIPLDISPGLLPRVAAELQVDEETLHDLTQSLRQNVILALIEYLLADDDEAEREVRDRQYRLLTGDWLRSEEFREFAGLVDSPPPQFMPPEARDALIETRTEVTIKYWRVWHDAYPAMAGLAVQIAPWLIERKEYDEAWDRLERSRQLVFVESTRREIHYFLVQLLIRKVEPLLEAESYVDALPVSIEMVELDDFQVGLVNQTLQLYVAVSKQSGVPRMKSRLKSAVEGWLVRATQLASESIAQEESVPRPSKEDVEKVRDLLANALRDAC